MTEVIVFSAIGYAFVGGVWASAPTPSMDRLEPAERIAVGAFWPLVLAYLAISGLGKLAQRLGQEED